MLNSPALNNLALLLGRIGLAAIFIIAVMARSVAMPRHRAIWPRWAFPVLFCLSSS